MLLWHITVKFRAIILGKSLLCESHSLNMGIWNSFVRQPTCFFFGIMEIIPLLVDCYFFLWMELLKGHKVLGTGYLACCSIQNSQPLVIQVQTALDIMFGNDWLLSTLSLWLPLGRWFRIEELFVNLQGNQIIINSSHVFEIFFIHLFFPPSAL